MDFNSVALSDLVYFDPLSVMKITLERSVEDLTSRAKAGKGALALTHNLDHIHRARANPLLANEMNAAEFRVADGVPLVWISKLAGSPLPGRVNGTDLFRSMCAAAPQAGLSVFLFGGRGNSAIDCAAALKREAKGLDIVGSVSPIDGIFEHEEEIKRSVDEIVDAEPNLVFIGLPIPMQVAFGHRIREALPTAVIVGVGTSFSYVSGEKNRAPLWAQRAGLEWAYRMITESDALYRRYLVENLPILISLAFDALKKRNGQPMGQRHG